MIESIDNAYLTAAHAFDGYKPVRHRPCGTQLAWVKENVVTGDRCKSEDGMLLDGTKPESGTRFPSCPVCECWPGPMDLMI